MKVIKKIRINNFCGYNKLSWYYFFGIPLFQTYRDKKGQKKFCLIHRKKPSNNQRIFYLKANTNSRAAIICIQRWHDVADLMGGFTYFVCDNKKLESKILSCVWFHNLNFQFIRSDRKTLKKPLENIIIHGGEKWRIIGHAMLTPFLHAAKHGFLRSYNIDADDIEILLRPQHVAEALSRAEEYANKKDIDCINLDMFVSRSFGTHWSFGCVYVRNPQKCVDEVVENQNYLSDEASINKYRVNYVQDTSWHDDNIDWFFTFLRDTRKLALETFYIEGAYVVHMPDIVFEHEWAFFFKWSNGYVYHPILERDYNDHRWAVLPIAPNILKIDLNLSEEDKYDYLRNYRFCDNIFREHCLQSAFDRNMISREIYDKYMNLQSW